jgi:hypothetical protein
MCIVELKRFNEKPSICTGAPVMREAAVVTADLIIRFLKIAMPAKKITTIPDTIRNFFITISASCSVEPPRTKIRGSLPEAEIFAAFIPGLKPRGNKIWLAVNGQA